MSTFAFNSTSNSSVWHTAGQYQPPSSRMPDSDDDWSAEDGKKGNELYPPSTEVEKAEDPPAIGPHSEGQVEDQPLPPELDDRIENPPFAPDPYEKAEKKPGFFKKYLTPGRRRLLIIIMLIVLTAVLVRACGSGEEKVSYLTEIVQRGDIVKTVNATGEVSAVQLVNVGAQVSGQIEVLAVALGQQVKKGDLIAEIDSTTQRNDLEINKAKLKTYETQLVSRQVALKVAELQYQRESRLKTRDAASDESLENTENTLAAARAAVDETESLISQTRISVNTAETNLGYTRISAPMDGTIVSIPVEEGQTVNANQTTPTIVHLADLSQMEIKMQISEGDVTKVKPGMNVNYTILSEPDRVFSGELSTVDPGLTTLSDGSYSGSIDSGTAIYYYGKLIVPNEHGLLRIGMTTQNTITIGEAKNVLTVPTIAIRQAGGKAFVNVLENGKPVEKEVELGISDNLNTEIISGLKEGDEVISAQMSASELAQASNANMRGRPRL